MAGIRRDTKFKGPKCMHCGLPINVELFKEGRTTFSMEVEKRDIVEEEADDGDVIFKVKINRIDYWQFCDECFSVLDEYMNNDFIKFPRRSQKLEIE